MFWRNRFIAKFQFIRLSKRWSYMKPEKNDFMIRSIPLSHMQVYTYCISISCLEINVRDFHFYEIWLDFASILRVSFQFISVTFDTLKYCDWHKICLITIPNVLISLNDWWMLMYELNFKEKMTFEWIFQPRPWKFIILSWRGFYIWLKCLVIFQMISIKKRSGNEIRYSVQYIYPFHWIH